MILTSTRVVGWGIGEHRVYIHLNLTAGAGNDAPGTEAHACRWLSVACQLEGTFHA